MEAFTSLIDLASERFGGSVLWATDDFFAEKENLLKATEAIFVDGKYTDRGKWMDGWESRRKRHYAESSRQFPDYDACIIRLGTAGIVRGVVVDTAHFKGNYPAACAIDAIAIEGHPDLSTLLAADAPWVTILERSDLSGDQKNLFRIDNPGRYTHLRLRIFPDGGVARLRVHGEAVAHPRWMGAGARPQVVDLAAAELGALAIASSDMFFGSRHNLILPGRAANMGDGWETKRSRRPGPDWIVVRLAAAGIIERAVVDTHHFKGNAPDACAIDIASCDHDPSGADEAAWSPLLPSSALLPDTSHAFDLVTSVAATHIRLRIWPDGGISRLRLYGVVSDHGRESTSLRYLRALPEHELVQVLMSACGSREWVRAMLNVRHEVPEAYSSLASLQRAASECADRLSPEGWEEAFAAHPRIGETKGVASQTERAKAWSAKEQASVHDAHASVLAELAEVNRAYEARFSRTFIVCATGKSAEEMLATAKRRLSNEPQAERAEAAAEQRKITELRLAKWVLG